jgi:hypothetical protein
MLSGKTTARKPVTRDDAQLVAERLSDPAYSGKFFNIDKEQSQ